MKAFGESPHPLTPEQVRVGTNQVMTYAERQAFWRNSGVGKLLGFNRWQVEQSSQINSLFKLSTEKWLNNNNQQELTENPNWHQIEAAIRELDGESKTLVTLGADEDTYMSIGGGAGKYIVTVKLNKFDFYVLVDLSKSDEIEKLVVGGQEGTYSANNCVELLPCLLAARTFVELGKLDDLLSWQEDKSLVVA